MSLIKIDDVLETIKNHNIFIKKIDSLFSFKDGELTIYKNISKFKNIKDYEIPIYKNQKDSAKWSITEGEELSITIEYNESNKKFKIIFDGKDADIISISAGKKSTEAQIVYISKDELGFDLSSEQDVLTPKEFKSLDPIVKYMLITYYVIITILFMLILKSTAFFGSMSFTFTLFLALIFLGFIHFKTKDIFIFFTNKNLDKIKGFLYK